MADSTKWNTFSFGGVNAEKDDDAAPAAKPDSKSEQAVEGAADESVENMKDAVVDYIRSLLKK